MELVENTVNLMKHFENRCYQIECCAESYPAIIPPYWSACGCVSTRDLDILKIPYDYKDKSLLQTSKQRKACNCLSIKTELIDLKIDPVRCTNDCLYCYWRD